MHVYVTGCRKGARCVAPMSPAHTFTLDNGQIDSNTLLSDIIVLLITLGRRGFRLKHILYIHCLSLALRWR